MKKDNELSIIVAGRAGSGKSAMMLQIEKLLKENGFNVELSFKGNPDYSGNNTVYFHEREEKNFDEKIEAIKERTKITLMEMQTSNAPINGFQLNKFQPQG